MNEPKYHAFISYSRRNAREADLIRDAIQKYRIPVSVRARTDHLLPQSLSPVFLDRKELKGGILDDELKNNLDASKHLILLCSPDSAKSGYVNLEVRRFVETGKKDRIIPVVLSDTLKNGEAEAIPPALVGGQVRWNFSSKNRREGILDIIACLLGVAPDSLKAMDLAIRRRQLIAACAATFCLLLIIGSFLSYRFMNFSAYYAGYVEKNGSVEGIDHLSRAQRNGRNSCYRVTKNRGRTILLERVDSSGQLISDMAMPYYEESDLERIRASFVTFSYDPDGRIRQATYFRKNGGILLTLNYLVLEKADLIDPVAASTATLDDAMEGERFIRALDTQNSSMTTRFLLTYDEEGRVVRRMYANTYDDIVANEQGEYGVAYEYDDHDRIVEVMHLDARGFPISREGFCSRAQMKRRTDGELLKIDWYGSDGNLLADEASREMLRDERGNLLKLSNLDEYGRLALNDEKYAEIAFEYDRAGRLVCSTTLDLAGNPCLIENSGASVVRAYDAAGNIVRQDYLDAADRPYCWNGSAVSWTAGYDSCGNLMELHYLDEAGKAAFAENHVASYRMAVTSDGRTTHYEAMGRNGEPVERTDGFCSFDVEYDAGGRMIRRSFFDAEGHPVLYSDGYASLVYERDSRGRIIRTRYFGVNGEAIRIKDGYASSHKAYDDQNHVILFEFLDTDGQPINLPDGYARWTQQFDIEGHPLNCLYYDADGRRMTRNPKAASWTAEYDSSGNQVRKTYDEPYVEKETTDAYGRRHVFSPFISWKATFDPQNRETGFTYWGEDGQAIERWMTESEPNSDADAGSGTSGKNMSEVPVGFQQCKTVYDSAGNEIEKAYFHADGTRACYAGTNSMMRKNYDEWGNITDVSCFGTDGNAVSFDGLAYSRSAREYDEFGNVIRCDFYDENNAPALNADGAASVVYAYDAWDNLIQIDYLDSNGKSVIGSKGYARQISRFNGQKVEIECLYYGTDDAPIRTKSGHLGWVCPIDESGMVGEAEWID